MIINEGYIKENKEAIIKEILAGKIFIYPTDTIYGIGCNALNEDSVNKIRKLKQRKIKPFSVIAPSLSWIKDNCELSEMAKDSLSKLPGPYTLFLKLKNGSVLPEMVNPLDNGTVGVRIPKHWFVDILAEVDLPFITTSVNVSGMPYMTSLDDLDETIKNNVDFIINEGEIRGTESVKIDLTK